tara:strand:+ start:214 stop:681 length:468 start_codon:yes stop_codon:yes gene_type:complete
MKRLLLITLFCFSANCFSTTKVYFCTYKKSVQSNPYDELVYTKKNPKLLNYKQKIIIDLKKKSVTREYYDIEWDGKKNIKIKQKRVSSISIASRDLSIPNKLIYWHEERMGKKGIYDGQVSIYSLSEWTKITLTHSFISVVSAYDVHYECETFQS